MKTLTTTAATTKCAELFRIGDTGEYRFRCCLCASEFASTGDILGHVQHSHHQHHQHPDEAISADCSVDPLSPSSSSPSSGVCLTMLSSSSATAAAASMRLARKRCGSGSDEDEVDVESNTDETAVLRASGDGYSVATSLMDTPTVAIGNNGLNDLDPHSDHDDLIDDDDDDPDEHDNADDDTNSTTAAAPHPAYICPKCGQTFGFNYALKMHQCPASRPAAEHTCDVCGLRTADARALDEHMDTHATGEPCVCPVCGAAFDTRHDLKQHGRSVHRSSALTDNTSAAAAAAVAVEDKPNKCLVCGRKYAKRAALDEHMRVHTGEKPFRCFVCGKAFARRVLVRQHERIHTGETPYKCRHCAMTFTYGASRRAHEKNKHPDV